MFKIKLLVLAAGLLVVITGCTTTSAGGSDMANIRATRGSESSQITRAEAEQYQRQQQIVSNELDIERKKRQNTTDAANSTINTANNLTSFIRRF